MLAKLIGEVAESQSQVQAWAQRLAQDAESQPQEGGGDADRVQKLLGVLSNTKSDVDQISVEIKQVQNKAMSAFCIGCQNDTSVVSIICNQIDCVSAIKIWKKIVMMILLSHFSFLQIQSSPQTPALPDPAEMEELRRAVQERDQLLQQRETDLIQEKQMVVQVREQVEQMQDAVPKIIKHILHVPIWSNIYFIFEILAKDKALIEYQESAVDKDQVQFSLSRIVLYLYET